ncbi:DUF815 domain-containing protein [Helicobacter sp.]|uniref:DUF815 domain-containing protein n=1 Tax=Helicobacter sp. TaxID=218 RepID=UPI0038902FCC
MRTTYPTLLEALENANFAKHRAYTTRALGANKSCFYLHPITEFGAVPRLAGIESQAAMLANNTNAFMHSQPALHALLYGARGCGKSSLVKATLLPYLLDPTSSLRVLELESAHITQLPCVFDVLRELEYRLIIFCDDLSFRTGDSAYRGVKSALQGSLEAPASNILLYATSNIRKIIESTSNLTPSDEITHEELALSDRFGLQIGFYNMGTQEYLALIAQYLSSNSRQEIGSLDSHTPESSTDSSASALPQNLAQNALNFAAKMGGRNARIAEEFCIAWRNGTL